MNFIKRQSYKTTQIVKLAYDGLSIPAVSLLLLESNTKVCRYDQRL